VETDQVCVKPVFIHITKIKHNDNAATTVTGTKTNHRTVFIDINLSNHFHHHHNSFPNKVINIITGEKIIHIHKYHTLIIFTIANNNNGITNIIDINAQSKNDIVKLLSSIFQDQTLSIS
jgi:hypothetical protein